VIALVVARLVERNIRSTQIIAAVQAEKAARGALREGGGRS
jgi:hypothetical protein